MAQVRKVRKSEDAAAASSSLGEATILNNDSEIEISKAGTTQARDDTTPSATEKPRSNFPVRDPSSSCRTSSSNWAVGKTVGIPGNISPEAIFGAGEDLVPMPLEESVFSSEAGEQFELTDNRFEKEADGIAAGGDGAVGGGSGGAVAADTCTFTSIVESTSIAATASTPTIAPSKGKDINSLTKQHRKRKAESLDEGNSINVDVDVDEFLQRIDHLSKYNEYQLLTEACEEPTDRDVLLGRGGMTNHHVGNRLYREKIEDFKPYYQKLSGKDDKQEFSKKVVNFVHSYAGRFLEKDAYSDGWVEVEKNKARKKVGQALREELRR